MKVIFAMKPSLNAIYFCHEVLFECKLNFNATIIFLVLSWLPALHLFFADDKNWYIYDTDWCNNCCQKNNPKKKQVILRICKNSLQNKNLLMKFSKLNWKINIPLMKRKRYWCILNNFRIHRYYPKVGFSIVWNIFNLQKLRLLGYLKWHRIWAKFN